MSNTIFLNMLIAKAEVKRKPSAVPGSNQNRIFPTIIPPLLHRYTPSCVRNYMQRDVDYFTFICYNLSVC